MSAGAVSIRPASVGQQQEIGSNQFHWIGFQWRSALTPHRAPGVLATNRFASLLGGLSKPTSPSDAPPAGQPGPRKPSEAEPLIAAADAVTKLPGLPALAEIEECEEELGEEEEIGGLREKAGGGGGLGVSWGKAGGAGGAADGGGGGLPVVEKLQGVDGRLLKVESAVNGLRGQLQVKATPAPAVRSRSNGSTLTRLVLVCRVYRTCLRSSRRCLPSCWSSSLFNSPST